MAEIQISVLASVSISFIMSKHKHLYIYPDESYSGSELPLSWFPLTLTEEPE